MSEAFDFDPLGAARKPGSKFIACTYQDLLCRPPQEETIEDVLPAVGSACIYGQSGSGKTFLALDMALAIARGDSYWFGYRIERRDVFFLALEGEGGIVDRLKAHFEGAGKTIPENFHVIEVPVDLSDDDDIGNLIALVGGTDKSVIFIDTLTRATPGLDLNSGADMGRVIKAIDRIRRECNCLVVAIYHSTIKSNSSSATEMGHSSYRGSLDASIFVRTDDTGAKSWTTVKAKDAEDGKGHRFGLSVHEVRRNQWNNPKTSCAVLPMVEVPFESKPINEEMERRALADQLENYIVAGYHDGKRYTATNLRDAPPPNMTTREVKQSIAVLQSEGRLIDVTLPKAEQKGSRRAYLHPIGRIPNPYATRSDESAAEVEKEAA